MNIKKLVTFLLLILSAAVFAQQPQLETSMDSTSIKIGSQANLILKTTDVDTAATVNFPEGKNFGQLEVLESYPVDTVVKGAKYDLIKKYGLTQFDSGRYVLPRLSVFINDKQFRTDSLALVVNPVQVDTLKQKMYDIKDVSTAESKSLLWLWILIGVVVAAGIAFGVWFLIKKNREAKNKPKEEEVHYESPIEKATTHLKSLEGKALLQRGEVKDYYSELTDIARTYIEEAIHIPAMESTTAELIEAMKQAVRRKNMGLNQETFEELERVLRNADLVKFAKMRPLEYEIAEDRNRIEKTIVVIDQSIPEEKEEDNEHTLAWLEAQRKKEKQKRKNRNIIIAVATVVVVLGVTFYFVGRNVMRNYITGIPTQELLEGDWVKSSYGNPPVTIETPKVLKRRDASEMIPDDVAAMIKEMQIFIYGAMYDNLYVMVSTANYNQKVDIDLDLALDGGIKTMESRGATNIIVKKEVFATESGLQGVRGYGNLSMPNPVTKSPVRMYYEAYMFKHANGLQQIFIMYREGDEYAPKILDRIKESIEITKLNN
nr:hypothetical protein [Flavobacterium suaedae]